MRWGYLLGTPYGLLASNTSSLRTPLTPAAYSASAALRARSFWHTRLARTPHPAGLRLPVQGERLEQRPGPCSGVPALHVDGAPGTRGATSTRTRTRSPVKTVGAEDVESATRGRTLTVASALAAAQLAVAGELDSVGGAAARRRPTTRGLPAASMVSVRSAVNALSPT